MGRKTYNGGGTTVHHRSGFLSHKGGPGRNRIRQHHILPGRRTSGTGVSAQICLPVLPVIPRVVQIGSLIWRNEQDF